MVEGTRLSDSRPCNGLNHADQPALHSPNSNRRPLRHPTTPSAASSCCAASRPAWPRASSWRSSATWRGRWRRRSRRRKVCRGAGRVGCFWVAWRGGKRWRATSLGALPPSSHNLPRSKPTDQPIPTERSQPTPTYPNRHPPPPRLPAPLRPGPRQGRRRAPRVLVRAAQHAGGGRHGRGQQVSCSRLFGWFGWGGVRGCLGGEHSRLLTNFAD